MILPYQRIRDRCRWRGLITPWCERTVHNGMTYGLGPAGYDIRAVEEIDMFDGDFRLVSSIERFNMPDDLLAQVCDKSTLARRGLFVQNTIIEPGWRGHLTLELTAHRDVLLAPGSPIAQIVFETLETPTIRPYDGKYQDQQAGAVNAVLEER